MPIDILIQQIERKRKAIGLSQNAMAARVGISQSSINIFLRGRKMPSVSTLRKMGGAVGLDLVWDDKTPAKRDA